ncbi:MAG: lysophospholipid acyltransferase family protein [Chloroflexota bacterium]
MSQTAVAGVLHLLANIQARDMDRCPPRGPVILASNHVSYFDIPLIGAWTPRTTLFFSKSEIKRWPVIGQIATRYGTIFVRRGESDRQAVRETLTALGNGQMVGVFPEGTRSRGQGLQPTLPGIALLAQRSGATIWPVAVTGSERMGTWRRPTVTLTGGEPFDPLAAAREVHGHKPTHQQVADTIMKRVAALLPESYRGRYG